MGELDLEFLQGKGTRTLLFQFIPLNKQSRGTANKQVRRPSILNQIRVLINFINCKTNKGKSNYINIRVVFIETVTDSQRQYIYIHTVYAQIFLKNILFTSDFFLFQRVLL